MGGEQVITTVKDVSADKFINAFAKHMKQQGRFEVPKWADVVKTGVSKELAPYDPDWLYVRAASVARHVYNRGGSGVGSFRKVYGSQQRRGTCTNHFVRPPVRSSGTACSSSPRWASSRLTR